MKKLFLTILFAIIVFGCKKTEDPPDYKIVNGYYLGQFHYQGINYGYGITFNDKNYMEHIFGGLYYQKWGWCYTVGTYSIESDKLVFEIDSFVFNPDTAVYQCNPDDWLLPGEYTIDYLHNDSLVFERGEGDSWIIYYLKREADVAL